MILVFFKFCLCGCLLASLFESRRQITAGESTSSSAAQPMRFAFLRFHFRNWSIGQEVRVESRDRLLPVSVAISCPRDRNAALSTVTVQPGETVQLDLPLCCLVSAEDDKQRPGIELSSNGSIDASVALAKLSTDNSTRMSEDARLNLIPVSQLGTSYLLFPPLRLDVNNSTSRHVEIFVVAVRDKTSITMVETATEASTSTQLDSFETFSMRKTTVEAKGIRILSSHSVAVFIFDGTQYLKTEAQTTTAGTLNVVQTTTAETLNVAQNTTAGSVNMAQATTAGTLNVAQNTTVGAVHVAQTISTGTLNTAQTTTGGTVNDAPTPTVLEEISMAAGRTPCVGVQFQEANVGQAKSEAEFQYPSTGADDFGGYYYTAMQVPPDFQWSATYRLELSDCLCPQIHVGLAAATVNVTRVRLKEEFSADRVLTIAGNQLTHVILTFDKAPTASVNIEADDTIQLLVYDDIQTDKQRYKDAYDDRQTDKQRYKDADDDRQTDKQRYKDASRQQDVFRSVFAASKSAPPAARLLISNESVWVNIHSMEGDFGGGGGVVGGSSDRGCRLVIRHRFSYNGDGGAKPSESTGNKWVVKHKYNYTSPLPASTESFYPAVSRRTQRTRAPPTTSQTPSDRTSFGRAPIVSYSQSSIRVKSDQTAPSPDPDLTSEGRRRESGALVSRHATGDRGTEPKESGRADSQLHEIVENENATGVNLAAANTTHPGLFSSTLTMDNYWNDTAIARQRQSTVNSAIESADKNSPATALKTSATSSNLNLWRKVASSSDHTTPPGERLRTPLRFIYRPYSENDVRPASPSNENPPSTFDSTSLTSSGVSDSAATYRPVSNEKTRTRQGVVHKTLSLFVVKQDAVDRSGHKVVNYFEVDAAQVDPNSTQDRGVSPTVIAVITSLCGAVFFVIACILGFVITEVLCAKGKLQKAKISPCIDISNAGY